MDEWVDNFDFIHYQRHQRHLTKNLVRCTIKGAFGASYSKASVNFTSTSRNIQNTRACLYVGGSY